MGGFGPNSNLVRLLVEDKRYDRARILACSLMMQVDPSFRGSREELLRHWFNTYCTTDWFRVWSHLNDAANDTGGEGIAAMVELRKHMGLEQFRMFETTEIGT